MHGEREEGVGPRFGATRAARPARAPPLLRLLKPGDDSLVPARRDKQLRGL
jgi:hypothetical protein